MELFFDFLFTIFHVCGTCQNLYRFAEGTPAELKKRDLEREAALGGYKSNAYVGLVMIIDNFARDLNGLRKTAYIDTGVNCSHLMLSGYVSRPQHGGIGGGFPQGTSRSGNRWRIWEAGCALP